MDNQEMIFANIIPALLNGAMVSRRAWDDKSAHVLLKDGFLVLHKQEGDFAWTIREEDLLADDWVVIGEVN